MNADQVLLALETSGKSGSVAILYAEQGEVVCHMELLATESGSAKTLAPAIERLLSTHQIEMKRLAAIALLTGPGSFTGLRVGAATAKSMAYALKIPTIEIDTLDVIAMQCPVVSDSVYTVIDAYRGQVFCAEYAKKEQVNGAEFFRSTQTEIMDIEKLLDRAIKGGRPDLTIDICGPGCERMRKFLSTSNGNEPGYGSEWIDRVPWVERVRWIDGPTVAPTAASVARLGYKKWLAGDVMDPFLIQPRYYRASAAEEVAAKPR